MRAVDRSGDELWVGGLGLRTAWGRARASRPDVPGGTPNLCDAVDSTGTAATP
jgi:hypothetical protein